MQVTFWGTRGSIPKAGPTTVRYGGNTSCVSVRTDSGTLLVLDCGTGIHELGQVLTRDGDRVDGHLLVGHTHWDHIQGLPFFAPLFQRDNVWHVYGPRGLDSSIDSALAGQMLVRLSLDGETVTGEERLLQGLRERIRDVRVGPDGAIFLVTDNSAGRVLKLTPAK